MKWKSGELLLSTRFSAINKHYHNSKDEGRLKFMEGSYEAQWQGSGWADQIKHR